MYFMEAKEEYLPDIMELYQDAMNREGCTWNESYPNADILQEDFQRGDLFVWKKGEEIAGAISIDRDALVEQLSCWSSALQPSAELARLVVKASYENQGIAKKMIVAVSEIAFRRGYQGIHYLVSPKNARAVRSYASLQFSKCGEADLYDEHWHCYEKASVAFLQETSDALT